MKVIAWNTPVMGLLGIALMVASQNGAKADDDARPKVDVSKTHQRLSNSLAVIQSTQEATQELGQIQRRHLWLVGEALPWRSTLQPSCLRQSDYELKQAPEPWPVAADAPALRVLLADRVPGIRALAAEALATLHQPEDLPRLAALVNDPAEATWELVRPFVGPVANPKDLVGPEPEAVTRHTWRKSYVAQHAARGIYLMLGACCPRAIVALQARSPDGSPNVGLSRLSDVDSECRATLDKLAAGDPKDHFWYWQEHIHRSLHQCDDTSEAGLRNDAVVGEKVDADRRTQPTRAEQQKAKKEWIRAFFAETRDWPAERRAMVRLLAYNVHQGGADMVYYDHPEWLLFDGSLELGLEKSRIFELLEGVRLWPDERTDRGGRNQIVERLAMGWRECFDADDVPRLLTRFNSKDDLWSSGRAALVVALANLSLDDHWPLLKDQFFEGRDHCGKFRDGILEWLMKAPAGDGPTNKLIDLVSDERYRPLWLETERPAGKVMQGGNCRRRAAKALNARIRRDLVTDDDLVALKDPQQGPAQLPIILARIRAPDKP